MSEKTHFKEIDIDLYTLRLVDYISREFKEYLIPLHDDPSCEGPPIGYFRPAGDWDATRDSLTVTVGYQGDWPPEIVSIEPDTPGCILVDENDPDQLREYLLDQLSLLAQEDDE